MRRAQLTVVALWMAGVSGILSIAAQDATECPNLNKCKKSEAKDKKECPKCAKAKIKADEALCTSCARKDEVCRLCGLPKKGSGKKPGGGTPDDAAATITAADMKEFIMRFASDEMEGRNNATPGIQKARAFLIDHLKKAGAKPLAGGNFEMASPSTNCMNVGTLYEGTDPKLKDEYVIVGSHMDHIGKGGGDGINNGADDNGSGSTTNKEICEALFKSGVKTRRSIINLWFTGEEDGLVGSRDYCSSPAVGHEKVVAMLNCDMLGRNPDKAAPLYGVGSSPQFSAVVDKAMSKFPKANVQKVMEAGQYFLRSDQVNFWRKGIPVMFITTGMHPDYHQSSDSPDKINCERMAELGKFMLFILLEIANGDTRPTKDPNFKER